MRLPTVSELIVSLSFLLPARRRPAAAPRPRRARPSVEPLEERDVPSASLGWAFQLGSTAGHVITNSDATDSAGNVYVTGSINATTNFDPNPNDAPVTLSPAPGTPQAGYLAKYTASGSLMWVQALGRNALGVKVDSAGDAFVSNFTLGTGNSATYFLTKFDPNGNLLWVTNLSQSLSINTGNPDLTVDGAGNPYLTGDTGANGSSIVAKLLGTNGSVAWTVSHGFGAGRNGYDFAEIAVDGGGNVYQTGEYVGTVKFGTYKLTSPATGPYGFDVYVLELNAAGGIVWAGGVGTDTQTWATGIAIDGSGSVFLSGVYNAATKQSDFDPGTGVHALSGGGGFVEKLGANHTLLWVEGIGSTTNGGFNGISLDGSGNVYLTGSFRGSVDFDPGAGQYVLTSPAGGISTFVLKLDTNGTFVWAVAATTSGTCAPYSIAVDSAGDVYVVGYFVATTNFDPNGTYDLTSYGYNPSGGTNYHDGFVWKLTQS